MNLTCKPLDLNKSRQKKINLLLSFSRNNPEENFFILSSDKYEIQMQFEVI